MDERTRSQLADALNRKGVVSAPLLQRSAAAGGVRLLERDPRARIRLESRALIEYLDTQPLRDELARGTRNRIAEGRFGR